MKQDRASYAVVIEMREQGRDLVDAECLATVFNTACTNDAPSRNRTGTSPSLNRRKKRGKMRGSLSEYARIDSDTNRTCCTCSVASFHFIRPSFTESRVLNCFQVLRWLFSVNKATVTLVGATFPA